MSTKVNGADVTIWVNVGGTPTIIGSQKNATVAETTAEIDASSKDAREAEVLPGRYKSTITCEACYVPSDTALAALKAACRKGTFVTVRKYQSGSPLEQATAIVTNNSDAFPDQGLCTVSITLAVSGGWSAAV